MHHNQTLSQGPSTLENRVSEPSSIASENSLYVKFPPFNSTFSPQVASTNTSTHRVLLPVISKFYGITIRMFFHPSLSARFHAFYGQWELIIGLSPLKLLNGTAPIRVSEMVLEWATEHHQELLANWERCKKGIILKNIAPLA